jgi:hypothetical protein
MREVDDRDYLLQGIAPPLRRNPDGTAVPPAPIGPDGAKLLDKPAAKLPDAKPDKARPDAQRKTDDAPRRKKPDGAKP